MEMTYRGVRYQANSTAVEIKKVANTDSELRYRGTKYQQNNSFINVSKIDEKNLVYRGVSVATGKKIRFLGRTCEQRKVVIHPVMA